MVKQIFCNYDEDTNYIGSSCGEKYIHYDIANLQESTSF